MATAEKPLCRRVGAWLKGRGMSTAPLTGQDARALSAFVHLVDLWGNSDEDGQCQARRALAFAVTAMQPSTRHLAKACIPMVLDWSHEEQLWRALVEVNGELALPVPS